MHNSPPDSESSGVHGSDVFLTGLGPGGAGEYIDPAALETRRGMPAVTSMPAPPAKGGLPSPLETTIGRPREPHLPPLSTEDRQALSRLLNRPQLHRFWSLVKERVDAPGSSTVFLEEPSESERLAIAGVFGLKVSEGSLHLRLGELDTSLQASRFGISLQQALLLVAETPAAGPTVPIPTNPSPSRETRQDPRQAPLEETVANVRSMSPWRQKAEVHPIVQRRPELFHWLMRLEEEGLPHKLAPGNETHLIQSVMELLATLPGQGKTLRPLAYHLFGDHHALDVGQPAGELVMQALAVISRRAPATTREERQKLWHWAGVEQDDVGSDVLTLGLRPAAGTAFCRALDAMAQQGEPMRLTLRQVQNHDLKLAQGTRVYVSQHPAVVAAAAERYPAGCRPVVVAGERPGPAVTCLLMALAKGGAKLFYHGDFDWHGIRVANDLYRTFPFQPWRYRTGDYLSQSQKQALPPQLTGHPVYARWDDGLADAMMQTGMAIEEERVLPSLLMDLSL